MQIQNIQVDKLIEYARNPRKNDDVVDRMVSCIKEFGFRIPIVAKSDGTVVDGHLRLKAARKLGLKEVPVVNADDLTEAQTKAFRLVANQSANWAEWDEELLKLEFKELDELDFDLELTGFDLDEIEKYLQGDEDIEEGDFDESEIEENTKVITKPGDLWILGNHRLLCGDSTKTEDVEKLMNSEKADMVFTDPPYGMKKEKDGILNDNLNLNDLLEFNKQWISLSFANTKENGSWYCWGMDEPLMDIYSNILKPMIKERQIAFRNIITWDKGNGQGQLSNEFRMYPVADEKCLFVMCGEDSIQGFCINADDYSENMEPVRSYLETEIKRLQRSDKAIANALGYKDRRTVNHWWSKSQFALPTEENYEALKEYGKNVLKDTDFLKKDYANIKRDYDKLKKNYDELKKNFYAGRSYFNNTHDNMNSVWHFSRISQKERNQTGRHATPKPVALCSRAIKSSSRENERVLDLFGGSGSTLIACEQLDRKCCMMELSPQYCDVIIRRWQKQTNQKAILESSGKTFDELFEKDIQ